MDQSSNSNSNQVEDEKENKIEANKLVETDDKVVETRKYNGIIWFIVIFIVLLIVVFAFT